MKAAQVSQYGGPDVIQFADLPLPMSGAGQLRVRVQAAGVGPWNALVREGRSGVPQTLPLTLGSSIAGVVDAIGPEISGFTAGDEVYGLTNTHFTGGYAEYSVVEALRIARKPTSLTFAEVASAPVITVTA